MRERLCCRKIERARIWTLEFQKTTRFEFCNSKLQKRRARTCLSYHSCHGPSCQFEASNQLWYHFGHKLLEFKSASKLNELPQASSAASLIIRRAHQPFDSKWLQQDNPQSKLPKTWIPVFKWPSKTPMRKWSSQKVQFELESKSRGSFKQELLSAKENPLLDKEECGS